jgi:hypothetical protein
MIHTSCDDLTNVSQAGTVAEISTVGFKLYRLTEQSPSLVTRLSNGQSGRNRSGLLVEQKVGAF